MMQKHWNIITPSEFAHERRALDFIRTGLPDHDPYRAWSNFEFQTPDGALYEVDLLVLGNGGFWLVEIKSRPGRLEGDFGTWTWITPDGRRLTDDNPIHLANKKSKALAGVLRPLVPRGVRLPFLEPLIFLSDPDLDFRLTGAAANHVCLTDRPAEDARGPRDGVIAALTVRAVPGARPLGDVIDAKLARSVTQAMDRAGMRPLQKERRVGDYLLGELLLDVENCFQDRMARHVTLKRECRARQYLVARAATEDQRRRIRGAAEREFRILDGFDHPNVLRVLDFKDHGFGPVLTFQHHPGAARLDHFLRDRGARLTAAQRLGLLRQLADGVRYAQARRVIHRGLAPQSVLVVNPDSEAPVPKIFNWQVGVTETLSSGTTHAEELVDQVALVYMAPEAGLTPSQVTPAADVFSLGAVAYHLFAGRPPAASLLERGNLLREHGGLDLTTVLDGAGPRLAELIRNATHPDVARRIPTAEDFYRRLDEVEAELVAPECRRTTDPDLAQKGDQLDEGFEVVRLLGQGSTGKALLVTRDGAEYVLKVARGPDDNPRLRDEGEVLTKVRSAYVVALHSTTEMHGRTVLVLDKAGEQTLAAHLREFGKCDLEWQERFGTDLLQALCDLEQAGVFHRDIKPENIGLRDGKQRRQLILFDFSLSRAPLDNLRVGTPPYLDPFLPLRTPPRWDPAAERYAAAVTLHEMATGGLPRYGDGKSDPALTSDEYNPDLGAMDSPVRDELAKFFRLAFHRDPAKRFDSAERMKRAWAKVFDEADRATIAVGGREVEVAVRMEEVRPDTFVELLGLSARSRGALDRLGVATVRDFLQRSVRDFQFQQNVGSKTRRELVDWLGRLRERFPDEAAVAAAAQTAAVSEDVTRLGLVALRDRLVGKATARDKRAFQIRCQLLGLEGGTVAADGAPAWPPLTEVADRLAISRQRVHQVLLSDRLKWDRDRAVQPLREEIVEAVYKAGGVLTGRELAEVILAGRGIDELAEADRPKVAAALARIVYESEQTKAEPRLTLRRGRGGVVLVACSGERGDHAVRLGEVADELAAEDPLPSVTRAVERLLAVTSPPLPAGCEPFGNERLLRVAVNLSRTAALNSQGVYPKGMSALKALKLGAGSFNNLGLADSIAPAEIRRRLAARYPEAETPPERPALDDLIKQAGFELVWDEDLQAYCRPNQQRGVPSSTSAYLRTGTNPPAQPVEVTPEVAAARSFEDKLTFAARDGGFLALSVVPKAMEDCEGELVRRFGLERVSLDALILDRLRAEADARKVKWDKVLQADAAPRDGRDWQNLQRLVTFALPQVEAELIARTVPTLLVHPGLLARYDALGTIDRLRDQAGRPGKVPVLWVLIAADEQRELPTVDGKAVPLITPGQRATVPLAWVYNRHRGDGV